MNNLLEYDDFINENIFTDMKGGFNKIKAKLIKNWDKLDFQKREVFLRKFFNYSMYGSLSIAALWAVLVLLHFLKIMDIYKLSKNYTVIYNIFLYMWVLCCWNWTIKSSRTKMIKRKMDDIKQRIVGYKFSDYVYAVIGNQKDIDKFIQKMKDDGWLNDGNIANIDSVNIIDFGGEIENNLKNKEEVEKIINKYKEVDPYGEEDWEDDKMIDDNKKEVNVMKKLRLGLILKDLYDIRLRKINDIGSFFDSSFPKKADKERMPRSKRYYKSTLDEYKNLTEQYD